MSAALLEIRDITCSFGGVRALDELSLDVTGGAITGVIGPNGAGKTTLFNIVSGFRAAQRGSIRFDEREISHLTPDKRAMLGIGRSFQHLGLVPEETATMNVLAAMHRSSACYGWDILLRPWQLAAAERRLEARAHEALARFGLLAAAETPVRELSFGKARLVEVAAVLVAEPRLVLLDEPTTGLDVREIEQLAKVLEEIHAEGVTIVVVAHDVRFVMTLCHEVYVLSEGRVLSKGTPAQVQRDPLVVEAYLGRTA